MGRLILYSFFAFLTGVFLYSLFFANWLLDFFCSCGFQAGALIDASNWLFLFSVLGFMAEFAFMKLNEKPRTVRQDPITNPQISVGMTAYNDELSIGGAVRDFKKMSEVVNIVVIDNNCVDKTAEVARKAGAKVVKEPIQGYGAACVRALKEARKAGNLICLVEGDQTYFAADIKKLLAYIENVDMVVGTRTTMEIVASDSQVTPFIQIGNIFVAKLIQLRYWGKLRLTDVGCTYRLIRPEALDKIIGNFDVTGNHFSPHMIMAALKMGLKVIECPIAFRKRVGQSKGVGNDFVKGLINGFQMIFDIMKS
ncbi:MAG: glycosyltransferase family 2 protein [archaeon]